jgi:transcriptional regulator with XRE-family HTH domain
MTPFGRKIRELRAARGRSLKHMASEIGVSAAYLSALEHGNRGAPSWHMLLKITRYFNVIWDEAEELERLARLSSPRVVLDTSGLEPEATEYANKLAERIAGLEVDDLKAMIAFVDSRAKPKG